MRVRVRVTGGPLQLGGARYQIGERLWLDTDLPGHAEVLERGTWVERVEDARVPLSAAPEQPGARAVVDAPPADRMVRSRNATRKMAGPRRRPRGGRQ